MRKIYMVSFDDDVPLSNERKDYLKVLADNVIYLLRGMECFEIRDVLCKDGIVCNPLIEYKVNGEYVHNFKFSVNNNILCEPFMLGDDAFCFTVNDGSITDDELMEIIGYAKAFDLNNARFKIDSFTYQEDRKNKNRLSTIRKMLINKEEKKDNTNIKSKKLIRSSIGMILR